MMHPVTLRACTPNDEPFLADVYARTRTDELAPVPWTDEQKTMFLRQQFHAQDVAYRGSYPQATFSVVELAGTPIGRLYVTSLGDDEVRIIDIALLPQHRGTGIGTRLIEDVVAEAQRAGRYVSLHVERWNPALALYERLGFEQAGETDVHYRMERRRIASPNDGSAVTSVAQSTSRSTSGWLCTTLSRMPFTARHGRSSGVRLTAGQLGRPRAPGVLSAPRW